MKCSICSAESRLFDTAQVLGKYEGRYYRCVECGFIQVENPHWLDEAYSSAITQTDLGYAQRNISSAPITQALITVFFRQSARYIDYGGGYGLFVRLMRDQGYNFFLYDKHCQNVFANGFEADLAQRYDLLTAFEVFEHLVGSLAELDAMFALSDTIFLSTLLLPEPTPKVADWWYYSPTHGQHISFYTRRALEIAARQRGRFLTTNGSTFHLISPGAVSPALFRFLCRRKVSSLLSPFTRRKSLLFGDVDSLAQRDQMLGA